MFHIITSVFYAVLRELGQWEKFFDDDVFAETRPCVQTEVIILRSSVFAQVSLCSGALGALLQAEVRKTIFVSSHSGCMLTVCQFICNTAKKKFTIQYIVIFLPVYLQPCQLAASRLKEDSRWTSKLTLGDPVQQNAVCSVWHKYCTRKRWTRLPYSFKDDHVNKNICYSWISFESRHVKFTANFFRLVIQRLYASRNWLRTYNHSRQLARFNMSSIKYVKSTNSLAFLFIINQKDDSDKFLSFFSRVNKRSK